MKANVVVLGAGPCGMTAAWKLAKDGYSVHLIERAERVGGFGASFQKDGFILDYGPHAFHIKKGDVLPIVESFFNGDLLRKRTNVRTLARGKYLKYPFELYNILTRLNPFLVLRMLFDFLMASVIYKFIHVPDDTFESWGIKRFGKTLYNFCFGKYTEKVWGMPARLISPKFASKKIKAIDLKSIISKILGGKGEEHEVYWDEFYYPEKGSGELYTRMAAEFARHGGQLHLSAKVNGLNCAPNQVTSVAFEKEGKARDLESDFVISTLPIRNLVLMMNPPPGDFIAYTAKRLKYRALVLVYLFLETERVSDAHWTYLLDHRFKFNRVTEQKNSSVKTCPDGKTVICFEICCNTTDEMWRYNAEQFKQMALEEIRYMDGVDPGAIVDCHVEKLDEAYAVCHLNYDQQIKDLLQFLSGYRNLISTGRQGLFLQNDMHDSMAMGLAAAEFFTRGREDKLEWYQEKTAFLDW
jgi:protoporphyrinogen oxidase